MPSISGEYTKISKSGYGFGMSGTSAERELEREVPLQRAERVRAHGGVHEAELGAQDAILVERLDLVEVGQDPKAHGLLGREIALAGRVEAHLEKLDERAGEVRVVRERVVLVLLGEGRGHALPVPPVGTQDGDLAPGEPGVDDEPVERVRLGLAAPHGRDRLRHALAAVRRDRASARRSSSTPKSCR